ncbi:hypothetical protein PPACK8108_LOCUS25376 [Phakopsora pachyrhizi]|uniref:Beta-glucuronidase C-terminal domain-containing protein n=1 Tax=Phakopsora pachyrhizi TaxID=170000 RepID=A0AAV0BTL1_PHAPC|nr:hypothetical protein PPACK8108_LOCUS25376 [Phakopsora pachyrhizi]
MPAGKFQVQAHCNFFLFSALYLLVLESCVNASDQTHLKISLKGGNHTFIRSANPLGFSVEFNQFPSWEGEFKNTAKCMENLEDALGSSIAIRIGGTSMDFATYDPTLESPLKVIDETANTQGAFIGTATDVLFGPKFMQLASRFSGPVTMGLNRRGNKINNTIEAVKESMKSIPKLESIELGNEPEYYGKKAPIAQNSSWTFERDARSQISWQREISEAVNKSELIQAGIYLKGDPWSIPSRHAYPQTSCNHAKTSLPPLMAHPNIKKFVKRFRREVLAAEGSKRPFFFSETNSATCGGGGISPMFGAALWVVDYALQSLMIGVHRLYFHQVYVNPDPYSFWGKDNVSATYYGAYILSLALRDANNLASLESSNEDIAAYAFRKGDSNLRVLVYNSVFYNSSSGTAISNSKNTTTNGERPVLSVTLSDLQQSVSNAKLLRLDAPGSQVKQRNGAGPTIGGSRFDDKTCVLNSPLKNEELNIKDGSLTFQIKASQIVLIELNDSSAVMKK